MTVLQVPVLDRPVRGGGAYTFDQRTLNRLLGRGGRIADTSDPDRYAAIFRRLIRQFGDRLRYGFMLPANQLLDGVVDHAIYNERRVPQLTTLAVFSQQQGLWQFRTALTVRSACEPDMCRKLATLYGDFGVPLLLLSPEMIDGGYLKTDEFAHRLKQAIYPHDANPPQPPLTPSPTPVCHAAAA